MKDYQQDAHADEGCVLGPEEVETAIQEVLMYAEESE